jgi:hypothetical protein
MTRDQFWSGFAFVLVIGSSVIIAIGGIYAFFTLIWP